MAGVKPDFLEKSVMKILEKYGDDVKANIDQITKEMAKKGAKAVSNASKQFKGNEYASDWTSQVQTTRLSAQGTIHNTKPGLPHLLEKGHALRGGGRAPAYPHIGPVEEKLIEEFQREVISKL